ncbi:MAG: hypothetical protein QNJ38_13550 [Prochloraceae cyanobacterium]|nr:hypothetical protein [Prochloraceae cyanobacterium]
MNRRLFALVVIILAVFSSSCSSLQTNASRTFADWTNREASVKCYSGGKIIFDSESDGKVFSEENSDGYVFIDKADKKLKEVSGDCIISYK